jgi:hypothetical protein
MSSLGPKRYDAFLSYNSQDRPAVHKVAERLKGERLELYLEEWELAPGREFQAALAEGLRDSKTCVVFLGPNGLGPWQKQELQVAIDKRARDAAFHVIPVLLPGTERPRRGDVAHLEFLINASWVEFLTTLDDERAFRSLVWGITGTRPPPPDGERYEGVCPYRGLEAFRPEDARFFFGRASLTGWLVSALRREVRAVQGVRFLGVLGPSGSGKSSVVQAGLVPRLMAGAIEGSERWPVAILRPGDDPLKNLAAGVVPRFRPPGALPDVDEARKLIDNLRTDAQALDLFAQMALHDRPEDVRLVVVVDQFEEVFTYRPQDGPARARFERDRDQFFANLLNAAATRGGRVAVVLTMRSDFLSACAPFSQLSAVLSAHQELVGPMTAAELREAIMQPAYLVGCEVESGLTEKLLGDVRGQSGALPLLQFALTEVWKKRDVRRLTLRAYTELGKDDKGEPRGIEGVLDHRANAIYGKLTPEDQDLCRRLFLRLVQPGEGTEDTKRRVPYRELLPADPARAEAVRQLVQALASRDARLITTEGTHATDGAVEVAHEALIRGWTQLRRWVDAERQGLRIQRRLTEAAQEWADARLEAKKDFLYSGARLAVCREWAETHRDELSSIEAAFLAASAEAERKHEQDELENERHLREAAEAAQAAERKRADHEMEAARRLRRRLWAMIGATAAMVVAAGLASYFWYDANVKAEAARQSQKKAVEARNIAEAQTRIAEAQTRIAESRRLAALSDSVRAIRLDQAMLLAREAASVRDTLEARGTLQRCLDDRPEVSRFLDIPEGGVTSVAFGPGGTLAARYDGGLSGVSGVVLLDARGERLRADPIVVEEGGVTSVAFGPSGTLAAGYSAGGFGSGVVLLDARGERLRAAPIAVKEGGVTSVAFGPGGTLAAGYSRFDGRTIVSGVVLLDARGERLRADPIAVKEGGVTSVAFGPGGTLAAGYSAGGFGSGVVLLDARGERLRPAPIAVKEGWVKSVAFGPGGTLAAGYASEKGGGVVLLDADPASWRAKVGRVANRNFTREEWRRFFLDTPYRRTIRSLPWPRDLPETERKQAEAWEQEHPLVSDAS